MNSKYEEFSDVYHHIWLFYEHLLVYYLVYVLVILFCEIFFFMKAGFRFFRVLKTANPSVLRHFLPFCTRLIYQEEFCNRYQNHCTKFQVLLFEFVQFSLQAWLSQNAILGDGSLNPCVICLLRAVDCVTCSSKDYYQY